MTVRALENIDQVCASVPTQVGILGWAAHLQSYRSVSSPIPVVVTGVERTYDLRLCVESACAAERRPACVVHDGFVLKRAGFRHSDFQSIPSIPVDSVCMCKGGPGGGGGGLGGQT